MPSSDSDQSRKSKKKSSRDKKKSRSSHSRKDSRERKRRRRSRSSSYDGRRERSKKSKDRQLSPDRKNLQAEIASVKQKMRAALSSAQSELGRNDASAQSSSFSLTVTDEVLRQDDIKKIDIGSFNQAYFVSNRDDAVPQMDQEAIKETKKMNQHENAIFGTVQAMKEEEEGEVRPSYDVPIRRERFPLAHENLSENPELRKKRWFQKWTELRSKAKMSDTLSLNNIKIEY